MTLIFTLISLTVIFIFVFRRKVLFDTKAFLILLFCSLILFALNLILKANNIEIKNAEMLGVPMLQLIFFYIISKIFKVLYKRNPKDTFWTMDKTLMKDGIFNFIFLVFAVAGTQIIVDKVL